MSRRLAGGGLAALESSPSCEVLIIGGGINGLATFRELALAGVDVVAVERGDWCQGASGASSHMIHGGIRYLENGEFRLVKEAVSERNRLLRLAPHYVKPLETTIPVFSTFSGIVSAPARFLTHNVKPGNHRERGAALIKIGLSIYDLFSRDGGRLPRHRFHGRRKSLLALPQLNPRVRYTATYFDASLHEPERLALDVLTDGLAAGGRAVNYLEFVGRKDDKRLVLRSMLDGRSLEIEPEVIVNTCGPWTDACNARLGQPTSFIGGTKGSHIVLDHPELLRACRGRELFFEHSDGRIVLIYPLKGRVLVGTTDVDVEADAEVFCTDAEVRYFFELIRHVFPRIEVSAEQIVYRFAGIRPLPNHEDLQPGFVSRDYRIERLDGRIFSLVGGKWTTFRALGEHMAGEVIAELGRGKQVNTTNLPIGGGRDFPATPKDRKAWLSAHRLGLSVERAGQLLDRYGSVAGRIIEYLGDGPERFLTTDPSYSEQELQFLALNEQVVHLEDVMLRRTNLAFLGHTQTSALLEVAHAVAPVLGWDANRVSEEAGRSRRLLDRYHGPQRAGG